MKIFAISDLHLSFSQQKPMDIFGDVWEDYVNIIKKDWKQKVADDDVVIMAGDLSWAMKLDQIKEDLSFFDDLPGKKVIVRGNHDYWWSSYTKVKEVLPENFYALQNNAVKIGEYVFCGTRGWNLINDESTDEDLKIFKREVIRAELALKSARQLVSGNEKIVLVLHFPPYNFKNFENEFMDLIKEYKPFAVVFGHIHQSKGKYQIKANIDGTNFYLTSCDLVENKLIEIS